MLYKLCRILSRSDIFFYLLIWLMLLLIAGTIAEHEQGLYYAQQNYFSVYIFLVCGFIPLPGTYTTLTAIFISLLSKLILDEWKITKLGTLITHISGLLLLLGGFLTAHFSHEGYIDLADQEIINYYSDYNKQELVITNPKINFEKSFEITNATITSDKNLNFNIQLVNYCRHCKLVNTNQRTSLEQLPTAKDNEQLHSIIEINIFDNKLNTKLNSKPVFLIINDKASYFININKLSYQLNFRYKRTYLPFNIQLNKFSAHTHPGTEIAKSYESEVTLYDLNKQQEKWHGVISMNNPLRYQGYTFYQSSYYIENNNYTSVLAVVYNVGQSFPYIASIILCVGILLHLLQRLPKLFKNRS